MPILVDANRIEQGILNEYIKILKRPFEKAAQESGLFTKRIIKEELLNSPEYYAMIPGGSLYHEIGNPTIESDLNKIIDVIVNSVEIRFVGPMVSNGQIKAIFEIHAIRSDYSDILGLQESSFFTEKGRLLRWLDWILLRGDEEIIIGYMFVGGHEDRSRTNYGIMVPGFGASWGIEQYGGVAGDNWITRATDRLIPELIQTIELTFKRELG